MIDQVEEANLMRCNTNLLSYCFAIFDLVAPDSCRIDHGDVFEISGYVGGKCKGDSIMQPDSARALFGLGDDCGLRHGFEVWQQQIEPQDLRVMVDRVRYFTVADA